MLHLINLEKFNFEAQLTTLRLRINNVHTVTMIFLMKYETKHTFFCL